MSYIEKEKLIKADIASIENRARHAFNQGYDLGYKEGKANCSKNSTGSTTKNDLGVDCVSRVDVLKLMQDNWHTHNGDWAMQESMDDIRALPSVTPQEPKMAHWYIDERPENDREVICSNCEQSVFKYHKLDFDYRPKYCPNCGADMRGEET